jgi:hypothetical protein
MIHLHFVFPFLLAVRKRGHTKNTDEVAEGEKEVSGVIFKLQSNRFLKENLVLTEYQAEPFFEDK